MGKVNLSISKIKTTSMFAPLTAHNKRTDYCDNIDKSRSDRNIYIIDRDLSATDYFKQRIKETGRYTGKGAKPIRKTAVMAYDICIRVPAGEEKRNPKFNAEKFAGLCREWCIENFGGENNIIQMVLHMDEQSPHVHALIVPITSDGRLCASDFLNHMGSYAEKQDSIAEKLAPIGIERGTRRGKLQHIEIKDYYSDIAEARRSELPSPEKGESVNDYYLRAQREHIKIRSQDIEENHRLKLENISLKGDNSVGIDWKDRFDRSERNRLAERQAYEGECERLKRELSENSQYLKDWDMIANAVTNNLIPAAERDTLISLMKKAKKAGIEHTQTYDGGKSPIGH